MDANRAFELKVQAEYAKLSPEEHFALQAGCFLGCVIGAIVYTAIIAGVFALVGSLPFNYHGDPWNIWIWTAIVAWACTWNPTSRSRAKERYLRRHGKL